jgi:hypothetical protein
MGSALAKATDWAAVTAWAAWATVAVYVVLGIFAWIQVLQARRLREEQARPFVIVDFEPGFLVYLTVENIGRTMARDVSIRFDEPLESTLSGPREIDESPLLRKPIPTLPPGRKIRVLFDQYAARLEAGLPLTYDVTLRYKGPLGKKAWGTPTGWIWGSTSARKSPQRACPNSSPRSRTSARSCRSGGAALAAFWCRLSTGVGNSGESGATIMCASCAARARGRWRGRCGIGRCGASGSASHSAPAAGGLVLTMDRRPSAVLTGVFAGRLVP